MWNFVLPPHSFEFKYTHYSNKNLLLDDSSSVAGMKRVEVFSSAGNRHMVTSGKKEEKKKVSQLTVIYFY